MRKIIFALLLMILTPSYADIFMQQNPDGSVTYTDTPSSHSTPISSPGTGTATTITSSPSSTKTESVIVTSDSIKKPYTTFQIASPKDQETIQNNPDITVQLQVIPELQSGDVIQILVDGKPVGAPQPNTQILIGRLDRGTHQFSAILYDKDGKILKQTNSVTVYIHYAHLGTAQTTPPQPEKPTPFFDSLLNLLRL